MAELITYTIYGIVLGVLILFIFTGLIILKKASENNSFNLTLLGSSFLGLTFTYVIIFATESWPIIITAKFVSYLILIYFIERTYYKNRKSPFKKVLIFGGINYSLHMVLSIAINVLFLVERTTLTRVLGNLLDITMAIVVFFWLGIASFQAFKNLEDKEIEPWIKTRIKLVWISSFIMMFAEIPDMIRIDPSIPYADFDNVISLIVFMSQLAIISVFVVCQSFAWIMPPFLKKFLNRIQNFQFSDKKSSLTEEEVLNRLKNDLWD